MDPFRWNFLGKNLFCMAVEGFVYFIFNLLIQYNFFLDHWWGQKYIIDILRDSALFLVIYVQIFFSKKKYNTFNLFNI